MVDVDYKSINEVISSAGDITIKTAGNAARGLDASAYGGVANSNGFIAVQSEVRNTVKTDTGNIKVESLASAQAFGLAAFVENAIAGNTGTVNSTIVAKNELISGGAKIEVIAHGGNAETVATQGPAATGLKAQGNGAENLINAIGAVTEVLVDVKAERGASAHTGSVTATGMSAAFEGKNALQSNGGKISLKVAGEEEAYGLRAEYKGVNTISSSGDHITIQVETTNSTGVYSAVHPTLPSFNSSANGMLAFNSGENIINAVGNNTAVVIDVKAAGQGATNKYLVNAFGMNIHDGVNEITTVAGNVDINVNSVDYAIGMSAQFGGSNTITTTAGGDITIATQSEKYAAGGMFAIGTGKSASNPTPEPTKNIINATTDSTVTLKSNTLATDVTTATHAGAGFGMQARKGGENEISGAGKVIISTNVNDAGDQIYTVGATLASGIAYGMRATSLDGTTGVTSNIIKNVADVDITVGSTGTAYGMSAGHGEAKNEIVGAKNVRIHANMDANGNIMTGAGSGAGMVATTYTGTSPDRPTNIISTSGSGNAVEIMAGNAKDGGSAYGLASYSGGQNEVIAADGTVDVLARNSNATGKAYGMFSSGGMNDIKGANEVNILANMDKDGNMLADAKGAAYGMYSTDASLTGVAKNTIEMEDTDVVRIHAGSTEGNAYGMYGTMRGKNEINGGAISIESVSEAGVAYAMYAEKGAKNTITDTTGQLNITAKATGGAHAMGITALSSGKTEADMARNDISNVKDVNITASADSGTAIGMEAGKNSKNSVDASGDITISATSETNAAWGLMAGYLPDSSNNVGTNIVKTTDGNIKIIAKAGDSASAIDNNAGNTTIVSSVNGAVTLQGTSETSAAFGMWNIGTATISAGDNLSIEATAATRAIGVHSSGTTTLTSSHGDVKIIADGNTANGLYTSGKTEVSAAGLVDIQALGKDGNIANAGLSSNALALYTASWNTGLAKNDITADRINILAKTEISGDTYAIYADTATNKLTATSDVRVTAENLGSGNAYGMFVSSTNGHLGSQFKGLNETTAETIAVSVTANNGDAYGLYATKKSGNAENKLTSTGGVISIESTSETGKAYAMYAEKGAQNTIQAEGSYGITVCITAKSGTVDSAFAMYAGVNGKNLITGSSSADFVSLTGSVKAEAGGSNKITTGAGDDRILLNGHIDKGGLSIEAGDGYDILTLRAANLAEFKLLYGAWLQDLSDKGLITSMSIERVQALITAGNETGVQEYLEGFFGTGLVELAFDHSADLVTTQDYAETVFAELADLAGTAGDHEYNLNSAGDDFIHVKGSATNVDFSLTGGGHDTLWIDADFAGNITNNSLTGTTKVDIGGNYTGDADHAINLSGATDHVTVSGDVNGNISTGAGNDLINLGHLVSGSVDAGAGDDWITIGGLNAGATLDGGDGNDTLVLNLGNVSDLANKFDFAGVGNVENLWVDLANKHQDILDESFFGKAFDALGKNELHVLRDATDSVDLTGWTKSTDVTHQGYNGESLAFETYTRVDGSDTLTLYLQSLTD